MEFEFDQEKSLSNKTKHGIDFVETQIVWSDDDLIKLPSKYPDEERFLFIGMIDEKHYAVIATYRGDCIRIISARRARREEVEFYESGRA